MWTWIDTDIKQYFYLTRIYSCEEGLSLSLSPPLTPCPSPARDESFDHQLCGSRLEKQEGPSGEQTQVRKATRRSKKRHAAETAVGRAGIGDIDAIERIRVFFFFAQLQEPVPILLLLSKQQVVVVDNDVGHAGGRRGRNVVVVGPAAASGGNSRRHRPE